MKIQDEICDYLKKNRTVIANDKMADNILLENKNDFLIGDEAELSNISPARYFKIYFSEIRTDQLFVQITPTRCFRSGYLKIDQDGSISLTDNKFKPYRSSLNFYFDQNKLKTKENWEIAEEERFSSKCIKGLLTLGMFAVAAGVLYSEYQDEFLTNELKIPEL